MWSCTCNNQKCQLGKRFPIRGVKMASQPTKIHGYCYFPRVSQNHKMPARKDKKINK